jgi:hypothetical protein
MMGFQITRALYQDAEMEETLYGKKRALLSHVNQLLPPHEPFHFSPYSLGGQ